MTRFSLVLSAILCASSITCAQTVLLVAKGGISSYGSLYIGNFGGGGGEHGWKPGPIVSVGARLRVTETLAIEGVIEYSTHHLKRLWEDGIVNDPQNSILEISAIGRASWGLFGATYIGMVGGLSLSSQTKDAVVIQSVNSQYTTPEVKRTHVSVVLGANIEFRVLDQWEFSLEGSLRGRTYVTPVVQLGCAYVL